MNEYLHPLSSKWYASRGIPYRRGYLFTGPPGTGKTSLSFSLAGIFGLDIHIINIMDPTMTESLLSRLFNNLPKRCIVLFEDIDAAGIKKRHDESDSDSDTEAECDDEDTVKTKARRSKSRGRSVVKGQVTNGEDKSAIPNGDAVELHVDGGATQDIDAPANISQTKTLITTNGKSRSRESHKGTSNAPHATFRSPSPSPKRRDHSPFTVDSLARALIAASRRARSTSPSPAPAPRKRRRSRSRKTKASSDADNEPTSKISLSGLLNVIDGVATHEGRILIMTTNHPEKLDPALIRAGRVDMQISFSCATASQIKSLFLRMYAGDSIPTVTSRALLVKTDAVKDTERTAVFADAETPLTKNELEILSTRFATELPEGRFAPSDVQGYLLLYRKKPREAVDKVGVWMDTKLVEMTEKEKKKSKV
jgi:chaperone BCS1